MTRIVCRQIAPRVGDLAANHERMLRTIAEATAAGADILVLPELASSGYVFASRTEVDTCAIPSRDPLIAAWSAAIQGPSVVVCGYAERGDDGAVYNSAVVLDSGGVLADYRKAHLWDREKLFFTPGTGRPPVVETRFGRIGVLICYDLEFPEYTRRIALDGADLIAVPTNWPHVRVPEGSGRPRWSSRRPRRGSTGSPSPAATGPEPNAASAGPREPRSSTTTAGSSRRRAAAMWRARRRISSRAGTRRSPLVITSSPTGERIFTDRAFDSRGVPDPRRPPPRPVPRPAPTPCPHLR